MDIQKELNQAQCQAVTFTDACQLVIAGAGSGKTRVLTYKIAYLLSSGLKPWQILALTFTNKAAREMRERICHLVGEELSANLYMGTFHSIFLRILRQHAPLLGYTADFTVYDQQDSVSLVSQILKEQGVKDDFKPAAVFSAISGAKNRLILPEDFLQCYSRNYRSGEAEKVQAVYREYVSRCRKANAMDFDDLLIKTHELFKNHEDVLEQYQKRFRYILVDEYQDTNLVQHQIVRLLYDGSNRVMAVGDDAQSIYSFRGAEIGNMLEFTRHFPDAQIFKLERNYRSTKTIVEAAGCLIQKNRGQIPKQVYSENDKGQPILVTAAYSGDLEADYLARTILKEKNQGRSWKDMAVLYRINFLSRGFEEKLRSVGIPYRIWGGLSFYQRKEVKDAVAYLRIVMNPRDEEALLRCINNPPRGIGETSIKKALDAARTRGVSLWDVLTDSEALPLGKAVASRVKGFTDMVNALFLQRDALDAFDIGSDILTRSGLMAEALKDNSVEGISRKENLQELANSLSEFARARKEEDNPPCHLGDYLSEIALMTDMDRADEARDPKDSGDLVTLMTIHAAKGLEFPCVFVTGLEDDILPMDKSQGNPRALEEERRLLYVAMTRAMERCYLSYARNRSKYGNFTPVIKSRFLNDIPSCYLKTDGKGDGEPSFGYKSRSLPFDGRPSWMGSRSRQNAYRSPQPPPARLSAKPSASEDTARRDEFAKPFSAPLSPGQVILHERFGEGTVVEVTGQGADTQALIRFKVGSEKRLVLKYARYKVIG